jgi:hypothetical protein
MIATAPTAAANSPTLKSGDWWTVNGTYHRTATGTGSDSGKWTEDGTYMDKYSVLNHDNATVVVSYSSSGSWSTTATQTWVTPNGGPTKTGTWSITVTFTVDAATFKVLSVSNKDYSDAVGHPGWVVLNPTSLTQGSSAQLGWYVPIGNARTSTYTDVSWKVDKQTVSIKGTDADAWALSYDGDHLGHWTSGGVYSKGMQTETALFDANYGIFLGSTISGSYTFARIGGGWTETYSATERISDSDLSFVFSVQITLVADPTNTTVTVDGVAYTGNQFPKGFSWNIGSTHTFRVNATIEGGNGVKYVFVQWSDGSKDTSRTITASRAANYTATFKTQYELKVLSDLGDPQGSGWYDAASKATFSVTSPQPETGFFGTIGGKRTFQGWTGDSSDSSPSASIQMDGPKMVKAQWATDYSQAYMILGGLAAAIAVVIVVAVVMLRRKGRAPLSVQPTPEEPSPVPPTPATPPTTVRGKKRAPTPSGPPPGMKFCVFCGQSIPLNARFCTNIKCGKPQQ